MSEDVLFSTINSLHIGYIDTSNVSDLVALCENVPQLFEMFNYALISCLDSHTSLSILMPSIARILAKEDLPIYSYSDKLLSSGKTVLHLALQEHLFNGFDEIWFLNHVPSVSLPKDMTISSRGLSEDRLDRDQEANLSALIEWMSVSKAVLGLADGQGLNYVTSSEFVASIIENTYISKST